MVVEIDPAILGQEYSNQQSNSEHYQASDVPEPAIHINPARHSNILNVVHAKNYTVTRAAPASGAPGYPQISPTSVSSSSSMYEYNGNYSVKPEPNEVPTSTNAEPSLSLSDESKLLQPSPETLTNAYTAPVSATEEDQWNSFKPHEYLNLSLAPSVSYAERPLIQYEPGPPPPLPQHQQHQQQQQHPHHVDSDSYHPMQNTWQTGYSVPPWQHPTQAYPGDTQLLNTAQFQNYFGSNVILPNQPYSHVQYAPPQPPPPPQPPLHSYEPSFNLHQQSATDYIPLHLGSWDTASSLVQQQARQPYKPLMLVPGKNLERTIMSKLTCKNGSNEFSPIFKVDSRYQTNMSTRFGRGKQTRIENLLRTGGTTRTFLAQGLANNHPVEGAADGQVSGQDILNQCVTALYAAIGTQEETASYLSPRTDVGLVESSRDANRGVKNQLDLPENVSLIMDVRYKDEIEQTFLKWSSMRPKTENFFRLEDKKGFSFSLEELKEALDIIMSRPPRRINQYVSRQLLTDVTYGQGRGVTEFSSNPLTHLHLLSNQTREPTGLEPPISEPVGGLRSDPYGGGGGTASEDEPFPNSKKSNRYDPQFCRRQGVHKQGWCSYCKRPGWFLMKNSGYLYHQNHEHGIFPNGCVFEDPLVIRRKVTREARWEGLCGICYHWIDLDHNERKLWGTWYRHYKLCVNEYEEIKKVIRSTFAPVELMEITYCPQPAPQMGM